MNKSRRQRILEQRESYKLTSTEMKISLFIAKFIVVILAILAYTLRAIIITLFKLKRWLFRLAILMLVLYGAFNAVTTVIYAPPAKATPLILRNNYTVKEIVMSMGKYEFGENQLNSLEQIIFHESGFNPKALNKSSGACGIFQSLPCTKMLSTSLQDQVQWGFNYIKVRYGTPNNAWAFWQTHGWY